MRSLRFLTLSLCLVLPAIVWAQGPRRSKFDAGVSPIQIELTTDTVTRIISALPEVTKAAAKHQSQFMSGLTGGAGTTGQPRLTPEETAALRAIFAKHGFAMEEFAMQVSALLATYLVLSPEAFEKQLPSEDKPEIRAILTDPAVPQEQKETIRKQIQFARANKDKIRSQLAQLASDENKAVVRPLLASVRKAFDTAQAEAKKAMGPSRPGPRRSKAN